MRKRVPSFSIKSPHEHDEKGTKNYNWLPDFVYGGIDGAVTTFAVVAGVEGAALSSGIILILGFANLLADGFSMATGKYLSDKAEKEHYEKIRNLEFQHLKERRDIEIQEIRDILSNYGFKGKDLDRATEIIISNPEGWVDLMMKNEFNMIYEKINPIKGAIATFTSFILIGLIPLMTYIFKPLLNLNEQKTFIITSISTIFALFIVGAVKSRFSIKHWAISGLEIASLGGIAALIAYSVGVTLKGLA